jgi:hypothetical protein
MTACAIGAGATGPNVLDAQPAWLIGLSAGVALFGGGASLVLVDQAFTD